MMDYCLSCLPSTINEKKETVTETGRRTKQGEKSKREQKTIGEEFETDLKSKFNGKEERNGVRVNESQSRGGDTSIIYI